MGSHQWRESTCLWQSGADSPPIGVTFNKPWSRSPPPLPETLPKALCIVCTNFVHLLSAAPHRTSEIFDTLRNSQTSNKGTSKMEFYLRPAERQLFAMCSKLLLNSLVCNPTAFNHTLSQSSAAQQLANPDFLCTCEAAQMQSLHL